MTQRPLHIGDLEKNLGYAFRDKGLLAGARDHPSLSRFLDKFERLEFLGDRVLGLVVSEYIFSNFKINEGEMSRMYAAFVCAEACYRVALKIGLDSFIRTADSRLKRNKTVLADAMEAVISCVFIDGGYNTTRNVILSLWTEIFAGYSPLDQEPKTRLQEVMQNINGSTPVYEVVSVTGTDHAPIFSISITALGRTVVANGSSKKTAETKAARMMLDELSAVTK
jgi:ribonuclease-3